MNHQAPLSYRRDSSLRSTLSAFPLSSCSQIRTTFHPIAPSFRTFRRSRTILPRIFLLQKAALEVGNERHWRQPCQKHPSRNTTSFQPLNITSGLPGRSDLWPSVHPRILARIRRERNRSSVDFPPCERIRDINRERVSWSSRSTDRSPTRAPHRKVHGSSHTYHSGRQYVIIRCVKRQTRMRTARRETLFAATKWHAAPFSPQFATKKL
jgi:hypothetical protein